MNKKYKAKFSVRNPRSNEWEVLTTSEVLPVEALSDKTALLKSRAYGSVTDKVLERYFYNDNGKIIFDFYVEIDQW